MNGDYVKLVEEKKIDNLWEEALGQGVEESTAVLDEGLVDDLNKNPEGVAELFDRYESNNETVDGFELSDGGVSSINALGGLKDVVNAVKTVAMTLIKIADKINTDPNKKLPVKKDDAINAVKIALDLVKKAFEKGERGDDDETILQLGKINDGQILRIAKLMAETIKKDAA
jgi:hypothetical protein